MVLMILELKIEKLQAYTVCKISEILYVLSFLYTYMIQASLCKKNLLPDNQGVILKMEGFVNPGIAR